MITLIDGPCKGEFMAKRAPVFLRAVKDVTTNEIDVLDQLEDQPKMKERVYVYQLDNQLSVGWIHVRASGKSGKAVSSFYPIASYKLLPDVDGEALRDTEKWHDWVREQIKILFPGIIVGPHGNSMEPSKDSE